MRNILFDKNCPILKNLSTGKFEKPCPSCGDICQYSRANYAYSSWILKKECKKCSNRNVSNNHAGYYKEIRLSWFNKYKTQAELRKLEFNITPEYVYDLYIKQEKKCSLSGVDIRFSDYGQIHTASIDRINNSIGYVIGNIQIVHKEINFMKGTLDNDDFIEHCYNVYKKSKQDLRKELSL